MFPKCYDACFCIFKGNLFICKTDSMFFILEKYNFVLLGVRISSKVVSVITLGFNGRQLFFIAQLKLYF